MNCIYCGKKLPDDSEFCAYCGKAVEKDLTPKCRACGRQVTEDSLFCPYCGTVLDKAEKETPLQTTATTTSTAAPTDKIVLTPRHISQSQTSSSAPAQVNKPVAHPEGSAKKSKKPVIFVVVALVVIALVAVLFSQPVDAPVSSTNSKPSATQLTPALEPTSGTLIECYSSSRESSLTVHASSGSACVVKVKDLSDSTVLSFYVRAGESATVDVPAKYLQVYFASGDTWYGANHLFGNKTQYSMDDEFLDFSEYTYEYTLYPVTDGNFSQTPIDASDF